MSTETTPTFLAGSVFISIIDGHAQAETHATFEFFKAKRFLGKLDLVISALGFCISNDNRFGRGRIGACRRTGFVHDDHITCFVFDPTQCIVVKSDLSVTGIIGNHQLNRVPVPCAVGSVFVVIIGDGKTEINVVIIVDDLNG